MTVFDYEGIREASERHNPARVQARLIREDYTQPSVMREDFRHNPLGYGGRGVHAGGYRDLLREGVGGGSGVPYELNKDPSRPYGGGGGGSGGGGSSGASWGGGATVRI